MFWEGLRLCGVSLLLVAVRWLTARGTQMHDGDRSALNLRGLWHNEIMIKLNGWNIQSRVALPPLPASSLLHQQWFSAIFESLCLHFHCKILCKSASSFSPLWIAKENVFLLPPAPLSLHWREKHRNCTILSIKTRRPRLSPAVLFLAQQRNPWPAPSSLWKWSNHGSASPDTGNRWWSAATSRLHKGSK